MDPMTESWVAKAELDLKTAARELGAADSPNYESVCFHAHQCAGRYLMARLQEEEVPFPETNHLVVLLHLCQDLEPKWNEFRSHLRTLTSYANRSAESEWIPDESMAREAFELCSAFRSQARKSLGL